MRVLWFTNTPSMAEDIVGEKATSGGWIKSLEKQLKNRNIEMGVVFYANVKDQKINSNGTIYYPIKIKRGKNKILRFLYRHLNHSENKNDVNRYIKIINDFNPDIIHIHGTENPFGVIIDKTNIPVIVSIQGIVTVVGYKFGRFINKRKINYESLVDVLFANSDRKKLKSYSRMIKNELQTFDKVKYILGRTEWDKNITRILAPNSEYFVINEVHRDSFYKHEWKNTLKSKFVIHSTSGPTIFKGLDTILKAVALLEKLNIDFEWNIAGINENDRRIKWILKDEKVSGKINFLGVIDENNMVSKLLGAHLYVMTSHIENSSNALSEAMLLGVPCIATFVGGTNTLITHGHDGILVQDDDPWALSGIIYQAYNNFDRFSEMGANARKTAINRNNPDVITSNLINVYDQIIHKNKSHSLKH